MEFTFLTLSSIASAGTGLTASGTENMGKSVVDAGPTKGAGESKGVTIRKKGKGKGGSGTAPSSLGGTGGIGGGA